MKTLLRILLILVVASIIGGLMYVGVNASGSSDTPSFEERTRPQFDPDGDNEGFRPEGERDGERGDVGFPGGVIKSLVLMSIAGGIYSVVVWVGRKSKREVIS